MSRSEVDVTPDMVRVGDVLAIEAFVDFKPVGYARVIAVNRFQDGVWRFEVMADTSPPYLDTFLVAATGTTLRRLEEQR